MTLRLGDDISGYIAEEIVDSVADAVPWFQGGNRSFLPNVHIRAVAWTGYPGARCKQGFQSAKSPRSAICPHCGAPNATPGMEELLAFVCRRCGKPVKVKVKPPAIQ